MSAFLNRMNSRLKAGRRLIVVYCVIYFLWGLAMNWIGIQLEIARFENWWQVFTCYVLYMVPISLLLRKMPFHAQYAYGLVAMGFLEFGGYYFETSYAYPDNVVEEIFGIRNFALGMALFFGLYFPLGNWGVEKIFGAFFRPLPDRTK